MAAGAPLADTYIPVLGRAVLARAESLSGEAAERVDATLVWRLIGFAVGSTQAPPVAKRPRRRHGAEIKRSRLVGPEAGSLGATALEAEAG